MARRLTKAEKVEILLSLPPDAVTSTGGQVAAMGMMLRARLLERGETQPFAAYGKAHVHIMLNGVKENSYDAKWLCVHDDGHLEIMGGNRPMIPSVDAARALVEALEGKRIYKWGW